MADVRDAFLDRCEAFQRAHGLSDRAFSLKATDGKDHKFLARLRSGEGITLTGIERAEAFMRGFGQRVTPSDEAAA